MRKVSELYGLHPESDIYIVGSGTSMRVFPKSFLDGKIAIGLNMAWKNVSVRYAMTIGPHVNVPEFIEGEDPHPEITWITKEAKARQVLTPEQFEHADRYFYGFTVRSGAGQADGDRDVGVNDSARVVDYVLRPSGDRLYQWSSISQTAVNLAANMGARNIVLVGCDNCSLLGNHHAHAQHTKWLGKAPDDRYLQYYQGLAEVRAALRQRGVSLLSMSPFLKLDDPALDFRRLCAELERPELVAPTHDISQSDHPRRFAGVAATGSGRNRLGRKRLLRQARAVARRMGQRSRSAARS